MAIQNSTGSRRGEANGTPRTISPRLLKRLAEASIGCAEDGQLWWVARYSPDPDTKRYGIDGPFPTEEAARRNLPDDAAFGVFGPFELTADERKKLKARPPVSIASITVTTTDGNSVEVEIDRYDAIFWGSAAVEKFVLPYYASASGLEYAGKVADDWFDEKVYLLAHSDDTEYQAHGLQKEPTSEVFGLTAIR
jgi:hypothetical protein